MDSEKKKLNKYFMKFGYKGLFRIVDSFDKCDIVAFVKLDDYKRTRFTLKKDVKEEELEEVSEGRKIHFLKFSNPRNNRNLIYFSKLKKKLINFFDFF